MIPATTRRVTSSSLSVIVRDTQGRQVARKARVAGTGLGGNSVTVVQLGGRKFQQTRDFSQTRPSRSVLNSAHQPNEKRNIVKAEGRSEGPLSRPEHAVISTFDLFSIGGPYFHPPPYPSKSRVTILRRFSWPQQLTYRWPYEGWQHIH